MHKKDSTFKMNLKFQYYFHFFEIQFKIQDLRLYYSTTHLKYTYIFLVTRVSFFPEQTTYIISITVLYKNNMVIPMLAFYLHANIHCCWRVSKRKLMSYVMFFFKAYQPHQDEDELLTNVDHLQNVIHQMFVNFMEILMVGLVKPEVDRHISNFFSKTEKSIGAMKLGHLANILIL